MPAGRPLTPNVERPPCPRGCEGRVLLNGHIKSPDKRFERPRYLCVPPDGSDPHPFTMPMPIRHEVSNGSGPHECSACERPLRRKRRRAHRYAIRDYAEMLVRLGQGALFREVGEEIRIKLGRVATRGAIAGTVGKSASPATHALDIFAPIIIDADAPTHWPAIIAIDALPLRTRHRKKRGPKPKPWPHSAKKKRKRKPPPGRVIEIGRVLVAAGRDSPTSPWRPLLFRFEGGGDEGAWTDFLSSLSGTPTWIVSDRDKAIINAVDALWPQSIHYFSHYHLQKNAREWLAKDKKLKAQDRRQLDRSIEYAFGSLRSFDRLLQEAMAAGATELLGWLRAARSTHRQQLTKQIGHEGYDKSATQAEAYIKVIKTAIYERRHHFTNVDRLNKLLGLVRLRAAGRANVDEWHPTENAGIDPATVEAGTGKSMMWKCDAAPDHEWPAQVRSRTLRGVRCPFCTGRRVAVSDSFASTHPDLAVEWHQTRNGEKRPEHFTFGSHHEAWWQCPIYKTHVYRARISSRTSMMSNCRKCADLRRRKKKPRRIQRSAAAA